MFEEKIIRINADASNLDSPKDNKTLSGIRFRRGDNVSFRVLFLNAGERVSASQINSAALEILDIGALNSPSPRSVELLMRKEVSEFDEAILASEDVFNAEFQFGADETLCKSGEKWLRISAEFKSGKRLTYSCGWIYIDDNFGSEPSMQPIKNPDYLTRQESENLFVNKSQIGEISQNTAALDLQKRSANVGKFKFNNGGLRTLKNDAACQYPLTFLFTGALAYKLYQPIIEPQFSSSSTPGGAGVQLQAWNAGNPYCLCCCVWGPPGSWNRNFYNIEPYLGKETQYAATVEFIDGRAVWNVYINGVRQTPVGSGWTVLDYLGDPWIGGWGVGIRKNAAGYNNGSTLSRVKVFNKILPETSADEGYSLADYFAGRDQAADDASCILAVGDTLRSGYAKDLSPLANHLIADGAGAVLANKSEDEFFLSETAVWSDAGTKYFFANSQRIFPSQCIVEAVLLSNKACTCTLKSSGGSIHATAALAANTPYAVPAFAAASTGYLTLTPSIAEATITTKLKLRKI